MPSTKALLVITQDPESRNDAFGFTPEELVIENNPRKRYSIGRHPKHRDLRIWGKDWTDDISGAPKVSDYHATIRAENNDIVTISNRSSGRQVYLNGIELPLGANSERRYVLHPGDRISLILTQKHQYTNVIDGGVVQPSVTLRVNPATNSNSYINRMTHSGAPEFQIQGDEIMLRGIELSQWAGLRELMEGDYLSDEQKPLINQKMIQDVTQLTPTEALIVNALYQKTIFENNPEQFAEQPESVFDWKQLASLTGKNLMPEKFINDFTVNEDDDELNKLPMEEADAKLDAEENALKKLHDYQSEREVHNQKVKHSVEEHIRVIRKKIDRNFLIKEKKVDNFLIRRGPMGYSMPAVKSFPKSH